MDDFNHEVASWLYNSVSKMDHDEAEMFSLFTMYEVHKELIDTNRRTLDRHVEEVQKSILADLHPEIREMVAKAFDPDTNFEEKYGKPQPRDKGGRWSKITIERGKGSVAMKPVNYRDDKIKLVRNAGRGEIDLSSALVTGEKEGNTFSERWTERGPRDHSTNERTYRRVQESARLLGHVPNKNVQAAAAVAEFAGKMGPEAEKVMGPAARRTAYRYRGTERQPDHVLPQMQEGAEYQIMRRELSDEDLKTTLGSDYGQIRTQARNKLTPEMKVAAAEMAAAKYLYDRLPSKRLSTLQRESGKLPPSEGLIISADGEIVTQAVGYNEDHYLPFNLKNLKGLKGGSYVRTRSTGGLTSEDIYTGLIAGARSVTVVSRSGVFTLDFDDDLRGGRRYSDKARQMVGRYAQTLDAVQSEKVAQRGLSPDERAEIREEVEGEMEGMGYKHAEIEAKIKEREKEYTSSPKLTQSELDDINAKALEATTSYTGARSEGTERVPADQKKRFNYYRSEFMDAKMEEKAKRMYQLDAEGYEAAMEALKEQFPYFVQNVQVKKLPRGSSEKDAGYVRPNYNRPKAVRAGYFDEDINGKGKFSAADLHYQNYSRRTGEAAEGAGETAEGERKLKATKTNAAEVRAQVAVTQRRNAAMTEAADAAKIFADQKDHPQLYAYKTNNEDIASYSQVQIDKLMVDLNKVKDLLLTKENSEKFPAEASKFAEAMSTVERTDRQLKSRVAFKEADWNPDVVSPHPQKFKDGDKAHEMGHDAVVYQKAFAQATNNAKLGLEVSPNMTDAQLKTVQKKHSDIYAAASKLVADPTDAMAMNKLSEAMVRAGMTDRQIEAMEDIFDQEGAKGLAPMAEERKKKALAVIELRSIMAAAEGKLTQAATPVNAPTSQTTVQSTVVSPGKAVVPTPTPPKTKKPVPDQLDDMSTDSTYSNAERLRLKDLAHAIREGDREGAEEILNVLPKSLSSVLRDVVLDEIDKQ